MPAWPQRLQLVGTTDAKYRSRWQTIVVSITVIVGLYLAFDSQAVLALTLPMRLIAGSTVWKQAAPPKQIPVVLGVVIVLITASVVLFLGSRATWLAWFADGSNLSGARHTRWSDALRLWATKPVTGAGPGSFTPLSELACEVPSLAWVHSVFLQFGSELGAIGVILLGAFLVGGLLFAARGSRPVSLITIAAWTALAVHSSIDHLEDFPIVALMGGMVLGWSGYRARHSEPSPAP